MREHASTGGLHAEASHNAADVTVSGDATPIDVPGARQALIELATIVGVLLAITAIVFVVTKWWI